MTANLLILICLAWASTKFSEAGFTDEWICTAVNRQSREDCGRPGITRGSCESTAPHPVTGRRCCYDDRFDGVPWCFYGMVQTTTTTTTTTRPPVVATTENVLQGAVTADLLGNVNNIAGTVTPPRFTTPTQSPNSIFSHLGISVGGANTVQPINRPILTVRPTRPTRPIAGNTQTTRATPSSTSNNLNNLLNTLGISPNNVPGIAPPVLVHLEPMLTLRRQHQPDQQLTHLE
uniref:P-type domain-containing protein n=1 Tax=Ciona savignyi TaxID=51511 RepID=H2Z9V5_CIOSA